MTPPGPWRPETPADPWTLTGEPLGEARVWPDPGYPEDPWGDDVASMVFFVEGRGYSWWAWGPFWAASTDKAVGLEPTAEAARAAADAWLADYCATSAAP